MLFCAQQGDSKEKHFLSKLLKGFESCLIQLNNNTVLCSQ